MKRLLAGSLLAIVVVLAGSYQGWQVLSNSAHAAEECVTFAETGKKVCGRFLTYWRANGGLAQQGLPLSDEIEDKSDVDGKVYRMQYFERAIFEYHPENKPPYDVLLSLVGREKYLNRFPAGPPSGETPLQVGQTFVVGGPGGTFRVTITDIQRVSTIGKTTAKGVFVVVFVKVTNLGKEPDGVRRFSLRDDQGRRFTYSLDGVLAGIFVYKGKTLGNTIQPSLTDTQWDIFDVAPDAENFTIVPQ